jgi:hypothetical protein
MNVPLLLWLGLGPAAAADLALLGNSYSFFNDLDVQVRALLAEADPAAWAEGDTVRLADGGLRFVDHRQRIGQSGSAWATAFAPGATWDWVILQEQSQIPGFPEGQADIEASVVAAGELDDVAEAAGAQSVFLLTWGRRAGDADNEWLYPDFETMQGLLSAGYARYRDTTSTTDRPTWIAPAGPAFARVHADERAAGVDPLASTSRFSRLYTGDGSHPSPLGTYLAACVLVGTLTGQATVGLSPVGGVSAEDAAWLQAAADATVADATLGYTYPWQGGAGDGGSGGASDGAAGDGGGSDGAAGDDGGSDGAAGDDGAAADTGPGVPVGTPAKVSRDGGCASAPASPAAAGALGALVVAARRRRR